MRKAAMLFFSMLVVGGCHDEVIAPPTAPALEESACADFVDVYDPACPDATVAEPDSVFEHPVAETHYDVQESPDWPTWQGETHFEVAAAENVCPFVFGLGVSFIYQGIRFWAPPPLQYTGPARASTEYPHLPHGLYETGAGNQIISKDGRWKLTGGVRIACSGRFYRIPRIGLSVWVGRALATGGYGTVQRTDGGSGGGERTTGGWGYGGATVSVASGVGEGWKYALDTFIAQGTCTEGWAIWIDGEQACRGDGTRVA